MSWTILGNLWKWRLKETC